MPKANQRLLDRYEVVAVAPKRYCAFDHKLHLARWAADPRSFTATQMLVEGLMAEAKRKGEETRVWRADTPMPKASEPKKPQPKPRGNQP